MSPTEATVQPKSVEEGSGNGSITVAARAVVRQATAQIARRMTGGGDRGIMH
jgi:hypothetical protein